MLVKILFPPFHYNVSIICYDLLYLFKITCLYALSLVQNKFRSIPIKLGFPTISLHVYM